MIEHFTSLRPTWLLFDADWMHTKQSQPFLPLLRKIVASAEELSGSITYTAKTIHAGTYSTDNKTLTHQNFTEDLNEPNKPNGPIKPR